MTLFPPLSGRRSAGCEALASALDRLLGSDAADQDTDELRNDLTALVAERARLDAAIAERAAEYWNRGEYEFRGHRTMRSWLRGELKLSGADASRLIQMALTALHDPAIHERLRSGALSSEKAAIIGRSLRGMHNVVADDVLEQARGLLLAEAPGLRPEELRAAVDTLEDLIAPEVTAVDDATHERNRSLSLAESLGGAGYMNGTLTPRLTALLLTLLDSLTAPLPDDTRTAAQRRHDALEELLTLAAAHADVPVSGGVRPHVALTVDLLRLSEAAVTSARWRGDLPGRISDLPMPPTWDRTGARASWRDAVATVCDAGIARVVLTGESMPLDVGRRPGSGRPPSGPPS
jgi:hypothetical protein